MAFSKYNNSKINGDICANVSFLKITSGWVKPWKILAQRKILSPPPPKKKSEGCENGIIMEAVLQH